MRKPALAVLPAALNDNEFIAQFATAPAITLSFHSSPPSFLPDVARRIALPPFNSTISLFWATSPLTRHRFFIAAPPPPRAGSAESTSETIWTPSNPVTLGAIAAMVTCWQPPMSLLFLALAAFFASRLLFLRWPLTILVSRKLSAFSTSFSARIAASVDSVQSCTGTEKLSPSLVFPVSSFVNPEVPNPS